MIRRSLMFLKRTSLGSSVIIGLGLLFSAAPAFAVSISTAIPGMGNVSSATPPGAYVGAFYNFALMASGILALGAIVYGGVLYATSAGNSSKQSEGKAWITSALTGLLLLGGAYLILYTINPNLVNLNLPSLQAINIQVPASTATCTAGTPGCGNTCISGTTVCGNYCCIAGFKCQHLGGTATRCVIQSSCPNTCGPLCCAATQHCIETQKSQSSPVQYGCL